MKNLLLIIGIVTITIYSCKDIQSKDGDSSSTKALTGIIINNPELEGHLNIMGYFVEPMISGKIDKNGDVTLDLPNDFNQITQKAFDTYNKTGDGVFALEPIVLGDLFVNVDSIVKKGKGASLSLAGKYYGYEVFNTDTLKVGTIYPTSSLEYFNNIKYPDLPNGTTGYHYVLLHTDAPVIINGTITRDSYIAENLEQPYTLEETYDVKLKPGWNVYKYEIISFVTDDNGNHAISKIKVSSVNSSAVNEWRFLASE